MPFWTRKPKSPTRVEVYADAAGKWRWRAIAANRKVTDASEQGYSTKYYAMKKATPTAERYGVEVSVVE